MWTVEFLGAGIVECKWVTLNLFCSLMLREAEIMFCTLLSDTVHGASHGEWALLVFPAIICQPWLSFQKVLYTFFYREEMAKKEKVFSRVFKGLQPLCCDSWVLMIVGSVYWSCSVPPKHGIETDDNLVMGNEHILCRSFHFFCAVPLHSALDYLCVRGYFGFFPLNHLVVNFFLCRGSPQCRSPSTGNLFA